jgi:Flp pilus assembly pilin Flp
MKKWLGKRGQSVLEYALLVALVGAAFIAMATYVRRSIQGGLYQIDGQVTAKGNSTTVSGGTGASW